MMGFVGLADTAVVDVKGLVSGLVKEVLEIRKIRLSSQTIVCNGKLRVNLTSGTGPPYLCEHVHSSLQSNVTNADD